MKNHKLQKNSISKLALVFFIFISYSSVVWSNQKSNENKIGLADGNYHGNTTCTCCGKYANKPGNDYSITVKNISGSKISFSNAAWQKREIVGNIENGKIVIDERNLGLQGLYFWGSVEVLDKNTFKIDVQWSDAGRPDTDKILNHCIGTFKNN